MDAAVHPAEGGQHAAVRPGDGAERAVEDPPLRTKWSATPLT
ncbi:MULTISPECIES: hypothetical protein [Streptomyces]|nr:MULTISPECIES: hypothetical protein [Streptomyces]